MDYAGDATAERPQGRLRRRKPYAGEGGHWAPTASAGWPWAVVDEGRGHIAADEAARGGERGVADANKSTGPSRGDFVCVDKAALTAVGGVVVDPTATGERCRRRRGGHGMAAGVFASAGESARMAVGDGCREGKHRPLPRTRLLDGHGDHRLRGWTRPRRRL